MTTSTPPPGRVVLVGAGPGDVELLTLKAARLIAEADWLVHDALVQPGVLALARTTRVISVGKRAGNPSARQSSINQILLDCARQGGLTVRLKGGDPLVFARAQEELDVLHAAGVAVEVVPGISSAQAAHAALALPMTERGRRRALVLATPQVHAPDQRNTARGHAAPAQEQAAPAQERTASAQKHVAQGRGPDVTRDENAVTPPGPAPEPHAATHSNAPARSDTTTHSAEVSPHFRHEMDISPSEAEWLGHPQQLDQPGSPAIPASVHAVLASLQQAAAPVPPPRRRVMSAAEITADPELRRWAEAIVAAGNGTLYMAATVAAQVRDTLLTLGMAPETPILWMLDVSLPGQEIVRGTLGTLEAPAAALKGKPALLLVGVPADIGEQMPG